MLDVYEVERPEIERKVRGAIMSAGGVGVFIGPDVGLNSVDTAVLGVSFTVVDAGFVAVDVTGMLGCSTCKRLRGRLNAE